MNMILAMNAVVPVFMVVVAVVSVWLACERSLLRVTDVTNDNQEATMHFLAVLNHAEHELFLHDDGDKVRGSLYDDEETVQAVRERLRTCPELQIRCLLNFNNDVKMASLRREYHERFQVRYLHRRPVDDVHFKIADGGKVAYVSTHPPGAKAEGLVRRRHRWSPTRTETPFGGLDRRFQRRL